MEQPNSIHPQPHPHAGHMVRLNDRAKDPTRQIVTAGTEFAIEDYWDRITGGSWMFAQGNPACLQYAMRSAFAGLPTDDEVVYGKIGPYGHLVHVSELEAAATE